MSVNSEDWNINIHANKVCKKMTKTKETKKNIEQKFSCKSLANSSKKMVDCRGSSGRRCPKSYSAIKTLFVKHGFG